MIRWKAYALKMAAVGSSETLASINGLHSAVFQMTANITVKL